MRNIFFIGLILSFITCNTVYAATQTSADTAINVGDTIKLPEPALSGNMSVEEALYKRRSVREYNSGQIDLKTTSQLLWSVYGVTMVNEKNGRLFKTAPSAGATYPLEIYLLAGDVESLRPGLYSYIPATHSIVFLIEGDMRKDLTNACLGQDMIDQAPLSIVFTAFYERLTNRYGKRGKDRYVCMDLGHAAQNLYLQATSLSLGTCAIGAFVDDGLINLFKLQKKETPLYVMPVGKLK